MSADRRVPRESSILVADPDAEVGSAAATGATTPSNGHTSAAAVPVIDRAAAALTHAHPSTAAPPALTLDGVRVSFG